MACEFKDKNNERFCHAIHGECQFLKPEFQGKNCPIYWAFLKQTCENCESGESK